MTQQKSSIAFYYTGTSVITGKYTPRKIHTKLHPGPECRIFHVPGRYDFYFLVVRIV